MGKYGILALIFFSVSVVLAISVEEHYRYVRTVNNDQIELEIVLEEAFFEKGESIKAHFHEKESISIEYVAEEHKITLTYPLRMEEEIIIPELRAKFSIKINPQ